LVGFGASGYVAASAGLPAFASWPVAGLGFLAVGAGTYVLVLKPLGAQQYNSLMSRHNYVGRDAVVTLEITAGGSGQVTFRDRQGARVTQTAVSDLGQTVAKGSPVTVVGLTTGGVLVHYNAFTI
jgi:membrane protein implicated in regulation of membrane protease activity